MSVMNYKQVVESVSRKTGKPTELVKDILDNAVETVIRGAISGKTVQIEGFGAFILKFLNRRSIPSNFLTGEEAISESHLKLSFKEYMPVKTRIAKKYNEMLRAIREDEERILKERQGE